MSGQKYITPKRCLAERKKMQPNKYITPKSDVDNLLIKHQIENKNTKIDMD